MFPLSTVWISRQTSVIISLAFSTLVSWLDAHQCKISRNLHLNTLTTDLQSTMQNIDKYVVGQTRHILTNPKSNRSYVIQTRRSKKSQKIHGKAPVLGSFLMNVYACLRTLKTLKHTCFLVICKKFLKATFLHNTSGQLLQ